MADIDAFINRWCNAGGTELANYQRFLTDLAVLLDLPRPEPATGDPRSDAYAFTGGTKRPARVAQILEMLTALGRARQTPDGRFAGNG